MRPSGGPVGHRVVLALAVAAIALVAFPGAVPNAHAAVTSWGTERSIASDERAVPSSASSSPIAGSRTVDLELALTPRAAGELTAFDAAVIDPDSPTYRHFLSPAEFAARFDPSEGNVSALESYFTGFGGHAFDVTPDQLGLRLQIPVAGAEAALGVHYESVQPVGAAAFDTAVGTPRLPRTLAGTVEGIDGLTSVGPSSLSSELRTVDRGAIPVRDRPGSIVVNNSSGGWWFTGADYAQGYHESALFPTAPATGVANATFSGDEAIATILMSGYNNTSQVNLPPWDPAVVQDYYNDTFPNVTGVGYNWSDPSLAGYPVDIDGVGAPAPGALGDLGDDTGNQAENSLDLEMAGSFAPGASLNNFYFAASLFANGSSTAADLQNIADDFATCLSTALTHNYGGAQLVAVSNSYGLPDLNDSLWDSELAHAAAIGVTVVAASGDQGDAPENDTGAFQGQFVPWPGSAAFNDSGTVAVGGLTVNLTGIPSGYYNGNVLNDGFDATVGGISSLAAWYDTLGGTGDFAGSEGGVSTVVAEPYWQMHSAAQPAIVNATLIQGAATLGRAEPDVAFPANATLIYVAANATVVYFETVEGTSVAAPIFAGFLAESAAVSGHLFGYLDPALYRMGSFFAANPGASGDPMLDVTNGVNFLFDAAIGWDPTTGWGTLDPVAFLRAAQNTTVTGYQYTGPVPGLPQTVTVPPSFLQQHAAELVVLALGAAVVFAILAVIVGSRPKPRSPYQEVPPGVYAPEPGSPPPPYGAAPYGAAPYGTPPATFVCPYCGSVRPAEPVRCPACGAF